MAHACSKPITFVLLNKQHRDIQGRLGDSNQGLLSEPYKDIGPRLFGMPLSVLDRIGTDM